MQAFSQDRWLLAKIGMQAFSEGGCPISETVLLLLQYINFYTNTNWLLNISRTLQVNSQKKQSNTMFKY